MRAFVLRARAAPTESQALLAQVGGDAHTEILAHTLMNAIFVAQSHRADVVVYLILESTQDSSRTITFTAADIRDLDGFHEQAWLSKITKALDASQGLGKEQALTVEPGIEVETISFERKIQHISQQFQLYMMDKKGSFIRQQSFQGDVCFILTDHIPMPKKSFNSLKRLGTEKISLGPTMMFASQCVVLINHELDLAGI